MPRAALTTHRRHLHTPGLHARLRMQVPHGCIADQLGAEEFVAIESECVAHVPHRFDARKPRSGAARMYTSMAEKALEAAAPGPNGLGAASLRDK